MKISSIMRFSLLIMPIVLIFFQPLSLAGRKGYGKMMQVRMAWCRSRCSDAGPRMVWCRSTDGVMQVRGWCDADPRMVRCRSTDVQILETETQSWKVGALLGKINVIGWICGQLSSLSKVFVSEWTLSLNMSVCMYVCIHVFSISYNLPFFRKWKRVADYFIIIR